MRSLAVCHFFHRTSLSFYIDQEQAGAEGKKERKLKKTLKKKIAEHSSLYHFYYLFIFGPFLSNISPEYRCGVMVI